MFNGYKRKTGKCCEHLPDNTFELTLPDKIGMNKLVNPFIY